MMIAMTQRPRPHQGHPLHRRRTSTVGPPPHLLHSETLPVMRTSTLGPPPHLLHSETLPVMRTSTLGPPPRLLHSETLPVMRTSTVGPPPTPAAQRDPPCDEDLNSGTPPTHLLHSETLPVMRTWPWSWRNPTQRNLKWGAH